MDMSANRKRERWREVAFWRDAVGRAGVVWGVVWAVLAVLALVYFKRDTHLGVTPTTLVPTSGWWWWTDQRRYLAATEAWAAGVLDPRQHWYLPGYPLLGAAFVHLTPVQPFLLPDLACLLAAAWAFAALAARLLPELRGARALGAAVFLATILLRQASLDAWVIPWTTTPIAPLAFASLALGLAFAETPGPKLGFLTALTCASIALFRLTEAVVLLLGLAPFLLGSLARRRPGWPRAGSTVLAALLGGLIPTALLAAGHLAVNGFTLGPYIRESRGVGFEWTLIPLRWATLVLDPHPLFAEGQGLAMAFPWVLPGIAGMAACLVVPRLVGTSQVGRSLARHALVIGVVGLHMAFYLAYRDLHPQGLWRFNNYHYFKWVLPVFGLYAALLVVHLLPATRWRAALAGIVALALLLPWRAEFVPGPPGGAMVTGPHTAILPHGFASPSDGLLLAAQGSWGDIYSAHHTLLVAGRIWYMGSDIKALPVPGGLLMVPLRRFAAGNTVISFDESVTLDPAVPPVLGRQEVVFGIPCLLPRRIPGCAAVTAAR